MPSVSPVRTVEGNILEFAGPRQAFDLEKDWLVCRRPRADCWSNVLPVISSVMRDWVMPSVGRRHQRPSRSTVTRLGDVQHLGKADG